MSGFNHDSVTIYSLGDNYNPVHIFLKVIFSTEKKFSEINNRGKFNMEKVASPDSQLAKQLYAAIYGNLLVAAGK